MAFFKNTSGEDQIVTGIGLVKAGETIEAGDDFHSGHFEQAKKAPKNND